MKKAAVIGAGMAGAAAAWKLKQAGWNVTVYEKESFFGGRARTYRGSGYHVNTGAGFFTNFYPGLRAFLNNTELKKDIIENPKVVRLAAKDKFFDYKLDSVPSFFRIPWLSFGEKMKLLRVTAGLTLKKRKLDLVSPESLAPYDKESMQSWANRKFGSRAYEYLIRTAVEPYWYFSCEKGSAAMIMALTAWAAGARFFTLKGGMDQIVGALLSNIKVCYGQAVSRLTQGEASQLVLETDSGETSNFDAVVLATTAKAARHILGDASQLISEEARGFLQSQEYAANVNAYFFLPRELIKELPPQISPAGPKADQVAAVATHGSFSDPQFHPQKALLGIWLKDQASQNFMHLSEAEAWTRLKTMIKPWIPAAAGAALQPAWLSRRSEAIPVHAPGRYRMAAEVWKQQKAPLVLAGDYLASATLEGAMRSGFRAAETLIQTPK